MKMCFCMGSSLVDVQGFANGICDRNERMIQRAPLVEHAVMADRDCEPAFSVSPSNGAAGSRAADCFGILYGCDGRQIRAKPETALTERHGHSEIDRIGRVVVGSRL